MATPIQLLSRKITQSFKKDFSKETILSGSFQLLNAHIQEDLKTLFDSFENAGLNKYTKVAFINRFLAINSMFSYFEENNLSFDETSLSYIEKVFQNSKFKYNQLIKIWHLSLFTKSDSYYKKMEGVNFISHPDFKALIEDMKKYESTIIVFDKRTLDAFFSTFPDIYFEKNSKRILSSIKLNTVFLNFESGNSFQDGEDVFSITEKDNEIYLTLLP